MDNLYGLYQQNLTLLFTNNPKVAQGEGFDEHVRKIQTFWKANVILDEQLGTTFQFDYCKYGKMAIHERCDNKTGQELFVNYKSIYQSLQETVSYYQNETIS